MKILSIESSGLVASTAVMSDGVLVGEYTIHNKKTHSQTLLPMISDLLEMAEVPPGELDGIAVSEGPGSFTGLRIGASTAKGLAWTLGIPIVPVPSLMGLSVNIQGRGKVVCPVMDARRNQAYFGIYRITEGIPEVISEPKVDAIESVISEINTIGEEVVFLGDGVPVFEDMIRKGAAHAVSFAALKDRYQSGASVAALGSLLFEEKQFVRAQEFTPVYLRKSQAERERMEKSS